MSGFRGAVSFVRASEIEETSFTEEIKEDKSVGKDNDFEKIQQAVTSAAKQLDQICQEKEILAAVYLCENYEMKATPDENGLKVTTLSSGTTVKIHGVTIDRNQQLWLQVTVDSENGIQTGYIERTYLATADEDFLKIEEEVNHILGNQMVQLYANDTYADVEQFPKSYQSDLLSLKKAHPNWVFVKMNTGLQWDSVIVNETKNGVNVLPSSYDKAYLREGSPEPGWTNASVAAVKYYMDPRNQLTESAIFQFEQLTYNASYHTQQALQSFLNYTFMKGLIPPANQKTYASVIFQTGSSLKVSPFHLASRIYQEQGKGTSPIISGTYPGYEGYFNYFNIGATGTTTSQIITNALKYAKNNGWNGAAKSIRGGAQIISRNYIQKGQDTLYLQKFNVTKTNTYTHQYMTNLAAAKSEALSMKNLYATTGSMNCCFVFKIPVFEGMPENVCPDPTTTTGTVAPKPYSFQISIPAQFQNTKVFVDGVAYTPKALGNQKYEVVVNNQNAKTAVIFQYDENNMPVGMKVYFLKLKANKTYSCEVQTQLDNLFMVKGFHVNNADGSRLLMTSGINQDAKTKLTGEGVQGYTLKAYGTMIAKGALLLRAPFTLEQSGVMVKLSYGNYGGQKKYVDGVLNDGYEQFTNGLLLRQSTAQKTIFAFRDFVVLKKGNERIRIYGPIMKCSHNQVASSNLIEGICGEEVDESEWIQSVLEEEW